MFCKIPEGIKEMEDEISEFLRDNSNIHIKNVLQSMCPAKIGTSGSVEVQVILVSIFYEE